MAGVLEHDHVARDRRSDVPADGLQDAVARCGPVGQELGLEPEPAERPRPLPRVGDAAAEGLAAVLIDPDAERAAATCTGRRVRHDAGGVGRDRRRRRRWQWRRRGRAERGLELEDLGRPARVGPCREPPPARERDDVVPAEHPAGHALHRVRIVVEAAVGRGPAGGPPGVGDRLAEHHLRACGAPPREPEQLLHLGIGAQALLEPEDRRAALGLEGVVDEVEERLLVHARAVVVLLPVALHREHGQFADPLAHQLHQPPLELVDPDRRREQVERRQRRHAPLQGPRDEVGVEDRPCAVAGRVHLDVAMLLAELREALRDVRPPAPVLGRAPGALLHSRPYLAALNGPQRALDEGVRGLVEEVARCARPAAEHVREHLAQRPLEPRLPHEMDRVDAVAAPPADVVAGEAQPPALVDQPAVRPDHQAQRVPGLLGVRMGALEMVLEDRIDVSRARAEVVLVGEDAAVEVDDVRAQRVQLLRCQRGPAAAAVCRVRGPHRRAPAAGLEDQRVRHEVRLGHGRVRRPRLGPRPARHDRVRRLPGRLVLRPGPAFGVPCGGGSLRLRPARPPPHLVHVEAVGAGGVLLQLAVRPKALAGELEVAQQRARNPGQRLALGVGHRIGPVRERADEGDGHGALLGVAVVTGHAVRGQVEVARRPDLPLGPDVEVPREVGEPAR